MHDSCWLVSVLLQLVLFGWVCLTLEWLVLLLPVATLVACLHQQSKRHATANMLLQWVCSDKLTPYLQSA